MIQVPERFREITDSGVIPAPSIAGAVLLHTEEGNCLVVLEVLRLLEGKPSRDRHVRGLYAVGVWLSE
jgi:hypothetical protein